MKTLFIALILFITTNIFAVVNFKMNPLVFNATEGVAFSDNLKNYLVDSKIGGLIFGGRNLPGFLVMDSTGDIKGVANKAGEYKFSIDVSSTNDGGILGHPAILKVTAKTAGSLECKDRSQAYFVGTTPDKKFDLFSCPR